MSSLKQVQMPHSFFQKCKQEYRNWRWAMVREFIQNSYDAQAGNISFSVRVESGCLALICEDDGAGILKTTLGEKLRKDRELAFLSRRLVQLKTDVQIGVTWNTLAFDARKFG